MVNLVLEHAAEKSHGLQLLLLSVRICVADFYFSRMLPDRKQDISIGLNKKIDAPVAA